MLIEPRGKRPSIHESAVVAPNALVCGDVSIGPNVRKLRGRHYFSGHSQSCYVVRIGENTLGGQTVSVLGAGGRIYYYARLDSYAPNLVVGDQVTTETVLGYVGTTGNAAGTPPHLHFVVYASGAAVNPLPLLNDRPNEKSTEKRDPLQSRKKH